MRRSVIALGVTLLLLGPVLALVLLSGRDSPSPPLANATSAGPYRGSVPPGEIPMPEFTLRDNFGAMLDSRDLRGKVVVLTFLDSHCTDACPIIASQIAQTLARLTPAERRQVEAVAISSDPETDTPTAVHSFLAKQHALGKLRYLGAGQLIHRLKTVWRAFEILASAETGQHTLHSAPVRIYDPAGIWVSTLHAGADLNTENLAHDVLTALARPR
jgi:protein SCO1/2